MSKIKVRFFGPIKEGLQENHGWVDLKKVTVFIGNQGSGKSTIAKLIAIFSWIEKVLIRGDYDKKWFTNGKKFKNVLCAYHGIENYFVEENGIEKSEIHYQGEAYNIDYKNGKMFISENNTDKYQLPQIMYVPAERSFISSIKNLIQLNLSHKSLVTFHEEYLNAKSTISNIGLPFPINNIHIEYDKLNDLINLKAQDHKIRLNEASSGLQSSVPLYLVSWYLANKVDKEDDTLGSSFETQRFKKQVQSIWADETLTENMKRVALSALGDKFKKTAFFNIVEEPELNLFPNSQKSILFKLLEFNNLYRGIDSNKLIITTHSPYIINYLTIAIKGHQVQKELDYDTQKLSEDKFMDYFQKFENVVPKNSTVASANVSVYQMDEIKGSISLLDNYEGIPSDNNYLNNLLADSNDLYDQLLDLEEEYGD